MKPNGTVETIIGSAKQSSGVSMTLSLVWMSGRLHRPYAGGLRREHLGAFAEITGIKPE